MPDHRINQSFAKFNKPRKAKGRDPALPTGICESVHHPERKNGGSPMFVVCSKFGRKRLYKSFVFGRIRTREQALALAIEAKKQQVLELIKYRNKEY